MICKGSARCKAFGMRWLLQGRLRKGLTDHFDGWWWALKDSNFKRFRGVRASRAIYSLALAKARPDPDFRYFSKAIARASSENAI